MLGAVGKGMGAKLARVKLCRVSGDVRVWESCLGVGLVGDAELEPTYRQAGLPTLLRRALGLLCVKHLSLSAVQQIQHP
jgi:hypothetical protein